MDPSPASQRTIILGASRGLGAALAAHACAQGVPVTGFSRKAKILVIDHTHAVFEPREADFSTPDGQNKVLNYLAETPYDKLFYVAGGGPYGPYGKRQLKDHQWGFEVTFLFPAKLLHALVVSHKTPPQTILIGSAVAEGEPDPNAASYAAAKHALKGLTLTLQTEYPQWDLRLFSPGYMDTDLLPKNADVRAKTIYKPKQVAEELWEWSLDPMAPRHKVYSKFPISS